MSFFSSTLIFLTGGPFSESQGMPEMVSGRFGAVFDGGEGVLKSEDNSDELSKCRETPEPDCSGSE